MFGNNKNTNVKTGENKGLFGKARGLMLGLGGMTLAGAMLIASPAMASDRHEDHGRFDDHRRFEDHDRFVEHRDFHYVREYRPEVVIDPVIVDPAPLICDPAVTVEVDPIWVPDRYEFRTFFDHGHEFRTRVLVERGHYRR